MESLCTRENLIILLAAGGASWAVHDSLDDDVADNTRRHPHRWGDIQNVIAGIGNPPHHLAAIAALYAYSLHEQDVEVHELSKSLFNAVAITGGATVLLKAASGTGTRAPNNQPDSFGGSWPSGHTSSSFAFASVLDEYYGHKVGLPAYILAGLVGWERIDDREHNLSDVVFGAALGYVIGKTVAGEHLTRFGAMEIQPYLDPVTGTTGISLERRF
ncbi:MAG: phosphatase PAP2 family protein [Planctomycetes bacterium]|nr:phosphatase PAP2 family protein [Planctomycetota bacterium]